MPLAAIARSNRPGDSSATAEATRTACPTNKSVVPPQNFTVLGDEDVDSGGAGVQSVASGFQLATAAGPLSEEPVYGVAFIVEAIDVVSANEAAAADTDGESIFPKPAARAVDEVEYVCPQCHESYAYCVPFGSSFHPYASAY